MAKSSEVIAHIDGASRGNPGPAAYAVVMESSEGSRLAGFSGCLGRATNNVAEYQALLAALEYALSNHYLRVHVQTDSELLARQIEGVYKVKSPGLKPLQQRAQQMIARLESFSIQHVPREQNREADRLANQALDGGGARVENGPGRRAGGPCPRRDARLLRRKSSSHCAPPPPFTKGCLNPTDSFRFSKAKSWIWKSTGRNEPGGPMSQRMVKCVKLGKELPGLEEPPVER